MATTGLTLICFCYCCSKCCRKRCPKFSKWWKDDNPCTTIVFKPKNGTSIHSSRESVRCSESRGSARIRRTITEAAEAAERVCLNADNKSAIPRSKR